MGNKTIKTFAKKFKKEYKQILSLIKQFDRIAIFRHIMPDFDALGTQFGLATFIKDNFPNKEVHVLGDNHVTFTPRLFKETDNLNEDWFKTPFLAIIVDCANLSRVADPRFKFATKTVKIDHHPAVEHYGDVEVVETSACSASELVTNMLITFGGRYFISKEAASNLYIALAGDSGRFQYSSTSKHSFIIASELISKGIELSDIYNNMYLKKVDDLKVTAYVLNNFHVSEHGVAYYVLDRKIQEELNITTERGKENVNIFANIEGINCWCSITEDLKEPCFRISIRSRKKAINGVAAQFEGGGHAQASGAKINSLKDLDRFIKALDDLFVE